MTHTDVTEALMLEALMLCAVLLASGEPQDIASVRLAVIRGHGAMGKKLTANSGNQWGAMVRWMRARGFLVEDLYAQTWAAGKIPEFLNPPSEYMKAAATAWRSVAEDIHPTRQRRFLIR